MTATAPHNTAAGGCDVGRLGYAAKIDAAAGEAGRADSNRSAKPAVNRPEIPALKAYAETAAPNWVVESRIDFISRSPNGDITIKSRITVNCVIASSTITSIWCDENFSIVFSAGMLLSIAIIFDAN